jgi:hypothetical protein
MAEMFDDIPTTKASHSDPYNSLVLCKAAVKSDYEKAEARNVAVASCAYTIAHTF